MIIRSFSANNRKRAFELTTDRGVFDFPYAKCDPPPAPQDPIAAAYIDEELGCHAVTYRLSSGAEGFAHIEQALEYNRDPSYLKDLLLHQLTLQARSALSQTPLSKREIMRRLGTSPAQFYRLMDPANNRKSIDRMIELLAVLDCDVELVTHCRTGVA